MPVVNPHLSCHRHRYGYCARHGQAGWLWSSVARVDTQTGRVTGYDFGPGHYCGEPVFVPQPGVVYEAGAAAEPGWLLTVVYHAATRLTMSRRTQMDDDAARANHEGVRKPRPRIPAGWVRADEASALRSLL